MSGPMILNIYGYQDSGKTVTVEKLVKKLVQIGYRVSSVKHSSTEDEIDEEGKDTWRHWKVGSDPVVLSAKKGTVFFIHSGLSSDEIIESLKCSHDPDVIILEGFKDSDIYPKISIGDIKPRKGTIMNNPDLKTLVHYVEHEVEVERLIKRLPMLNCRKCGMDCDSLARAIVEGSRRIEDCREMPSREVEILVGGKRIATGTFVSEIVDDTIRGMLGSLKGYESGKDVEIRLKANKQASKRSPSRK